MEPCTQVLRYLENNYWQENRLVYKQEWRWLKSLSCKGPHSSGQRCYNPILDAEESDMDSLDLRCDNPVHGKLYKAVMIVDNGGIWNDGEFSWHWEMIPYKINK